MRNQTAEIQFLNTNRGEIPFRSWGNPDGNVVLLLHGNAVHSGEWLLIQSDLPQECSYFAIDLRGYGFAQAADFIDATNGVLDWVDDVNAFVQTKQLQHVHVVGHSLGGNVCWGLLARSFDWISSIVLVSPGSPFGFGASKTEAGILCAEDGAGSGAGMVHPKFVNFLREKELGSTETFYSPMQVFIRLLFSKLDSRLLKQLAEMAFEMQLGEKAYPGDAEKSSNWPGMKPGKFGPVNALSPLYQIEMTQQVLKRSNPEIPILWIYGENDPIISNASYADAGFLGESNLLPNWPGLDFFPPQPMLEQINFVLDKIEARGHEVERISLPNCGHFPFLEQKAKFLDVFKQWISTKKDKFVLN